MRLGLIASTLPVISPFFFSFQVDHFVTVDLEVKFLAATRQHVFHECY